jgi:hypothetical protein
MNAPLHTKLLLALKIIASITLASATIYMHIQKQNQLTSLRMKIPLLIKELKEIQEENRLLRYAIAADTNPGRLQQVLRTPDYSHLKYARENQLLILPEGKILPGNEHAYTFP